MKYIAPVALATAIMVAGCSQQNDTTANAAADNQAVAMQDNENGAGAETMNAAATPDFINQMALSDMYEIEAGKIASQKSKNAKIKQFADMMVKDHTASSTELKRIVQASGLTAPPTALDEEHQDKLEALRSADADDFDGTYADQQREAHQKAIDLLQGYGSGGDNAELKTFAQTTLPKVQGHADMIAGLDEAGADDQQTRR